MNSLLYKILNFEGILIKALFKYIQTKKNNHQSSFYILEFLYEESFVYKAETYSFNDYFHFHLLLYKEEPELYKELIRYEDDGFKVLTFYYFLWFLANTEFHKRFSQFNLHNYSNRMYMDLPVELLPDLNFGNLTMEEYYIFEFGFYLGSCIYREFGENIMYEVLSCLVPVLYRVDFNDIGKLNEFIELKSNQIRSNIPSLTGKNFTQVFDVMVPLLPDFNCRLLKYKNSYIVVRVSSL